MKLVKRRGYEELFDERKLYGSVYHACMSLRMEEAEAELIAEKITKEVTDHLKEKDTIRSHEIFELVLAKLEQYHPDAAYMYRTHRDIS